MADLTIILIGTLSTILLGATAYIVIEYYRQLNKAKKEYENAREYVGDIVLSFNRELKREAEKLGNVEYKVEVNASRTNEGYNKTEEAQSRITSIEKQLNQIATQVVALTATITQLTEANAKTVERLSAADTSIMNTKMQNIEAAQDKLREQIFSVADQLQKVLTIPEAKTEASLPVMPIKRDKALASLTETEVAVLEFLSAEGPRTAPEIKEKVQLSREHTARLMKRLYEEGYLERETQKLPFKYSVKKEMEKLLKKPESTTTLG